MPAPCDWLPHDDDEGLDDAPPGRPERAPPGARAAPRSGGGGLAATERLSRALARHPDLAALVRAAASLARRHGARVATAGAVLALLLVGLHGAHTLARGSWPLPVPPEVDALVCLLLALPLGLLLEPAPGASARRTGLAALGGGLAAAALLPLAARGLPAPVPPWAPRQGTLALDLLTHAAWGSTLRALLVGAALAALAALPLLLVRRSARELEWQAAAGALGGAWLAWPNDLLGPGTLAGCLAGTGAYVVDRTLAGERGTLASPRGARAHELACALLLAGFGAAVLGAIVQRERRALLPWGELREPPEIASSLVALVEQQERYRAAHGRYAEMISLLDGADRDLAGGVKAGYVVRFACARRGVAWAAAADPVPPRPGLPHYRVDRHGLTVVGGPQALEVTE